MRITSRRLAVTAISAATIAGAAAPAQAHATADAGSSDAAQRQAAGDQPYPSLDGAVRYDLRTEAARAAGARVPVVVDVAPGGGLDWTAVGLGAGGGIALAAVSAGGMLVLTRRVRPGRPIG